MRVKMMIVMTFAGLAMLLTSCSSDEAKESCIGNKVTVSRFLEYRYMLNGKLVRPFEYGLRIKMIGTRPVVTYDDGTIAEKHVYVLSETKSVSKEAESYECGMDKEYDYDGIKDNEQKNDYTYVLKGWTESYHYYE